MESAADENTADESTLSPWAEGRTDDLTRGQVSEDTEMTHSVEAQLFRPNEILRQTCERASTCLCYIEPKVSNRARKLHAQGYSQQRQGEFEQA